MSHMSATGSTEFMKGASTEEYTTEFMKGSDLVLEKSVFTGYVPTRVYRAHLKKFVFPFDKSQF